MSEFLSVPPRAPSPPAPGSRQQRRRRNHGRHHRRPRHKKNNMILISRHKDVIQRLDKICDILSALVKEVTEDKTEHRWPTNSPPRHPSPPDTCNERQYTPMDRGEKQETWYNGYDSSVTAGSSWEPQLPSSYSSPVVGATMPDKAEELTMSGALPLPVSTPGELALSFLRLQQDLPKAAQGLSELHDAAQSAPLEILRGAVLQLTDRLSRDLNESLARLLLANSRHQQPAPYHHVWAYPEPTVSPGICQLCEQVRRGEVLSPSLAGLGSAASRSASGSSGERLPDAVPTSASQPSIRVPSYSHATPSPSSFNELSRAGRPTPVYPGAKASDTSPESDSWCRVSADADWEVVEDLCPCRVDRRSRVSL